MRLRSKRWSILVLQKSALVVVLYCIWLAGRQGIAAWRFHQNTEPAIESALKWYPSNPQYYNALAATLHFFSANANPEEIVLLDETAARLSPYNAQYWADLGAAQEWAGHTSGALGAFSRAQQLFPNSPDINWRAANFDIRARKIPEGLHALQKVLLGGDIAPRDVFVLATSATGDDRTILDLALPPRAPITLDYVNFLSDAGDLDAAAHAWDRLLQLNSPFDLRQTSPYLDSLIQHRQLDKLAETWSTLDKRFPGKLSQRIPDTNLIRNGSFESEILNMGFDWRVVPVEGAIVTVDSTPPAGDGRSLQIEFDGTQNLNYWHIFQFVPVRPGTRYKFSAYMRTQGITTDSGPRFELYDAYEMTRLFLSTRNIIGTSDWSLEQLEFETKANEHLLIVRVGRPASHKFDSQIAGTVWIGRVSLEPEN